MRFTGIEDEKHELQPQSDNYFRPDFENCKLNISMIVYKTERERL